MRIFFLIGLLVCSGILSAQELLDYTPIGDNAAPRSEFLKKLEQRYKKDDSNIQSNYKKDTKEIYKERYEYLAEELNNGNYYFDDTIYSYLKGVFDNLKKYIPEANDPDIRFLVSREVIPNAASTGEGSIIVMMGILPYLDNEDQLAFILCHELAHYLKDHSNKHLQKNLEAYYSKSTQAELKKIAKQEYGQTQKALDLLKDLSFNYSRHSRDYEKEADSLGLIFFLKTPYNHQAAISTLALLDTIDKDKYNFPVQLEKTFDFEEYPFKKSLLGTNSIFISKKDTVSQAEEDSLKTHPDCQLRIKYIEPMLASKAATKSASDHTRFSQVKLYSELETVQNLYEQGSTGSCFYQTLQLINVYPKNAYLHAMIGKCLNRIYDSLQTHTVNKILGLPDRDMEPEVKSVFEFLNNMRSTDLKNIAYLYLRKHYQVGKVSEFYLYQYWLACKRMEKTADQQDVAAYYKKTFPNGKYKLN